MRKDTQAEDNGFSVTDKGFIKYNEQKDLIPSMTQTMLKKVEVFLIKMTNNDFYQHPCIYILAKDSKDKKYDVNGTIQKF